MFILLTKFSTNIDNKTCILVNIDEISHCSIYRNDIYEYTDIILKQKDILSVYETPDQIYTKIIKAR